jgi:5-formyltetrahydrofolate cyclo-ligase
LIISKIMGKAELRTDLQKGMRLLDSSQRTGKSRDACKNLIRTPEFQNSGTIMVYLALPHEVDTHEIILAGWQGGKVVCVPKISWQQRRMIPVRLNTLETEFSTEVAGLRNPIEGFPVPFEEIDMIVIPGLGFDRKGNRLGRGGAYYDKFLSNGQLKAVRCGLAFEQQLIDSVPTDKYDEPIDLLVTDKQALRFKRND